MRGPWSRLPARLWLVAFCVVTGSYGLLAYLPFTYQAVIRFPMVSWVPAFVRWHAWLFLVAIAWNLWVDWPRLFGAGAARSVRLFHGVAGLGALAMLMHPLLPDIRNDGTSLALALSFLLLPTWLLSLDGISIWQQKGWKPAETDDARRLLIAALAAGLFGAGIFPGIAWLRGSRMPFDGQVLVWGWTIWAHLLVWLAVAALLLGTLSLGRFFSGTWMGPMVITLVGGLGLVRFLYSVMFVPIAFQGPLSFLVAGIVAALGASFLWGWALSLEPGRDPAENALDLALRPLLRCFRSHVSRLAGWILVLGWLTWFLLGRAAVFDWNFMFQKIIVVAAAALVFGSVYAAVPIRKPKIIWVWAVILLPIVVMNLFLTFDEGIAALPRARRALDQQAGRDVSVRLLRDALSHLPEVKRSIYRVLQQNSNIPRDVRTEPVDIQHVDRLQPAPGPKPDIFIFVVDSLRRDYLGAYNSKVRFTPDLDQFARESLVMGNAFTRYGATGLSEPSIWTGSLMLHKQYITPFHPMNSLQKLLETDGYQGLVSMDSILEVVVKPGPWMKPLDPRVGTQDLRLGNSLEKLKTAILARGKEPRPLFAFTQSQDLHISVVNREGQGTVVSGDFTDFYAPYASRVRRLDESFGQFISFLKEQGRYENSLIIVTADHGDSLGEEGRFGHAYTLFPEIVRIPMLIHLPAALRQGYVLDLDSVAFLTDLTPTLYYLLGHRPIRADRALGRPLFTLSAGEQAAYRQEHYLLASSYGAVFGLLDEYGKSLYIADGVNFVDYLYRLDEGPAGTKRLVTPELKGRYDQMILDDLAMLNRFYHFQPGR